MKRAVVLVMCLFVLALSVGCGSYKEDLFKICHAERLSGAAPNSGLAGTAGWLSQNLSTSKSKELFEQLGKSGSIDVMRAEVAANGVAPCPLLDPR